MTARLARWSNGRAWALGLATAVVFSVVAWRGRREAPIDPSLVADTLVVDGRTRSYLWWDAGQSAPLVLVLHGRLSSGAGVERLSGLLAVAKRDHFSVAYPDGVEHSWHDARDTGPAAEQGVDDVKFLTALIDALVGRGADASRVYVVGMSNGGFMALTLACRAADRVAGVSSVTGAVPQKLADDCAAARQVPVQFFLGDEDPIVPFAGGEMPQQKGAVLSAEAGARFFARRHGCGEPVKVALADVAPDDGTRVERWRFAGCAAEVELNVVHGGGHTWPGGWKYLREAFIGRVSADVSASEEAWRFFSGRR